jgi:regulator of sigma E protease
MALAGTILLYTVPFLALIFVIIVVHEWGHFWVARRLGIKVEAFSMGFGPELFGWVDRYGTRFKLCLLPLGGYVKMFGEGDLTRDSSGHMRPLNAMERKWAYGFRPVSHRAAVVAAGPLVNILFGALLISTFQYSREVMVPSAVVAAVEAGSPAAEAGLLPADRIVSFNGVQIANARVLGRQLLATDGQDAVLGVIRGDQPVTLTMSGFTVGGPGKVLSSFGIETAGYDWTLANPLPAVNAGIESTLSFVKANAIGLKEIALGIRPLTDLAGPIGIADVSGNTATAYGFVGLVMLMALLSINVGVVNLLPIPVLDGGHLVFMGIEVLRGKPLSARVVKFCSIGGLCAILALLVLVTGHDLLRLAV